MTSLWPEAWNVYLWWLAAFSAVTFIASLLAVPFFAVRIPADYFSAPRRKQTSRAWPPALRLTFLLCKNVGGILLFLAGTAMLFLPGQGLLTMLMGLVLMDFPGKFRLERHLVSRPPVFAAINWIRTRRGVPPLAPPLPDGNGPASPSR